MSCPVKLSTTWGCVQFLLMQQVAVRHFFPALLAHAEWHRLVVHALQAMMSGTAMPANPFDPSGQGNMDANIAELLQQNNALKVGYCVAAASFAGDPSVAIGCHVSNSWDAGLSWSTSTPRLLSVVVYSPLCIIAKWTLH